MRSFISWFNIEAIQVEDLNHEIACEAWKKGTKNIKLMDFLIKKYDSHLSTTDG